MNSSAKPREPYVGPRPFTADDESIFFGRSDEVADLTSLIIANRAVLVYAQSGAGKSSLLNAAVLPAHRRRGDMVIGPCRVSYGSSSKNCGNVYLDSLLTSAGLSREARRGSLSEALASARLERESARVPRPLLLLVIDQAEELFTTQADRWPDRQPFFAEIANALNDDSRLRVIFAMREEYIAHLEPYATTLPGALCARFRVERLRRDAALQAIERPLVHTNRHFAKDASEKLVDSLLRATVTTDRDVESILGEFVEPVQLQVICQNLWKTLPAHVEEITDRFVRQHGAVDFALMQFYEDCVRELVSRGYVEERDVRRWFEECLITSEKTRGMAFRGPHSTGNLPNRAVDALEEMYVVHAELRGGVNRWYELAHDRLIDPILRSNLEWREARVQRGLSTDSPTPFGVSAGAQLGQRAFEAAEGQLPNLQRVISVISRFERPSNVLLQSIHTNLLRGVQYLFLLPSTIGGAELARTERGLKTMIREAVDSKLSRQALDLVSFRRMSVKWDDYPYVFYEDRFRINGNQATRVTALRGTAEREGLSYMYEVVSPQYAATMLRLVEALTSAPATPAEKPPRNREGKSRVIRLKVAR